MQRLLILLFGLMYHIRAMHVPEKNHTSKQYFAIESLKDVETLLSIHTDWRFEHNVRGLSKHYVFSKPIQNIGKRATIETDPSVVISFHDLPPIQLEKRLPIGDSSMEMIEEARKNFMIDDPLFDEQWHLINSNYLGNDVNVTGLWKENITGNGVVAALVDDGLDFENPDLKENFCAEGSWDFNDNNPLPKPRLKDDYHGTRCAGEIAAIRNDVCGVGVAFNAKVSGIRILSGQITAEDEAAALVHALDVNDIYSCSWGPSDDGRTMQAPDDLVKKALIKGVTEGRDSKGALYVFASGNGGNFGDNCNFDGYTNSIFSITVGAIDWKGLHPPYSESCSAVMVVTYSSGSGNSIKTTDLDQKCASTHGGTSAAAPLAAGIYTLVLEANPNLTWRDVQYLSILSSEEINLHEGNWQMTAMGKRYSHTYGFGKLDAYKIVDMARNWKNVNPQGWFFLPRVTVNQSSNKSEETIESEVNITEKDMKENNLKHIEHVRVTVDISAPCRGHILIDLVSPDNVVSTLATPRRLDKDPSGFKNWTFMSVAHWGSKANGNWKLRVRSTEDDELVTLHSWRMKIFGETIDGAEAKAYTFEDEKENEYPSNIDSSTTETTTATYSSSASTMSSYNSISGSADVVSSTPLPDEGTHGPNKLSNPEKAVHLYIGIFIVGGLILVIYYLFFLKSRRTIRRSRAEAYEFDIIDTDSEYDSSINRTESISGDTNDATLENFDFGIDDDDDDDDGNFSNSQEDLRNPFTNASTDSHSDSADHTTGLLHSNDKEPK